MRTRRRSGAGDGEAGRARAAPSARCSRASEQYDVLVRRVLNRQRSSLSRRADQLSLGSRPAARSLSRSRSRGLAALGSGQGEEKVNANAVASTAHATPSPACSSPASSLLCAQASEASVRARRASPAPISCEADVLSFFLGRSCKGGKESARRDEEERRGEDDDDDPPATSGRTSACGSWSRAAGGGRSTCGRSSYRSCTSTQGCEATAR